MLIINRKIYKEFFLEGMPHIDRNSLIAFCLLVMRSLFHELFLIISSLGGTIDIHPTELQIAIAIPFGKPLNPLSESEMIKLLTQGLRDRDIAQQLIISESAVKFHINNILPKLKARTRFQSLNLAIANGWLH